MIDDVMRLNYETVQEISMLQTVLAKNRGKMASLTKAAIYDRLARLHTAADAVKKPMLRARETT